MSLDFQGITPASNVAGDVRVDGVPMVHQVPRDNSCEGSSFGSHWILKSMPDKIRFNTSILDETNIRTRFRRMNLFRVRLMHSVGAEPNQRGNSGHHQTQKDTIGDWEVELGIFSFKGNVDGQFFEPKGMVGKAIWVRQQQLPCPRRLTTHLDTSSFICTVLRDA